MNRGTIRKEQNGTYTVVIDMAPAGASKRQQVWKRGFTRKKEAEAHLDMLREQLRSGAYVAPSRQTLGDYLRAWLEGLPITGKRATTVDGYMDTLGRYVMRDAVAEVPLQALTAPDLDALYSRLATTAGRKGEGVSLRTVRYVASVLGKALSDAERKGLVVRNVARLATPPGTAATRAPEPDVWTPAELAAFLDSLDGHQHRTAFYLAAMTGLRRGEVCGLRWADVDLDAARLTVRQTLTQNRRGLRFDQPKSKRSRRTVDLDADTVAVLREHRRHGLEQRMMMGAGFTDHGLVFCRPDGEPWRPESITQAFDRHLKAKALPRIRLHDLRHTHATHLLAAGVNPRVVSERLGHASVAFTLDTYGHVLDGQQADAAAAVATLVSTAR